MVVHGPIVIKIERKAEVAKFSCSEIVMTRWPDQRTVTDQSQKVELRFIIDLVLANCVVPRIATKIDV